MIAQPRDLLCTSALVRAEILYGIGLMAEGARRQQLASLADAVFGEIAHILSLPSDAAAHYARLSADRRRSGRPIGTFDALIAATALAAGAAIATRDIAGFADCGLDLIDPWNFALQAP